MTISLTDDEKLIEPDYAEIARRLLHDSARVQPDETVTILGRADSLDFCEALELECRRIGALPFVVVGSDAAVLAALADPAVSEAALSRPSPQLLAALKESQVVITTFFERANPVPFQAIAPSRLVALRRSEEAPSDIIFDGKRRWVGTEVPTAAQAAALGCDWHTLHNIFWRAMSADYADISYRAGELAAKLASAQTVRLLAPNGTDLSLTIGGRPIECDDGVISAEDVAAGAVYLNLPSGEVCYAPPEQSANGRAVIPLAFWQGQPIRNLELEFTNGTVAAVRADEGLELFRQVVANGGGDCYRLGEFGIGLNPAVRQVTGFTLLDEKMIGTAHIALGENRALGGVNNSALHWDLVVQGATVLVDGQPI